MLLILMNLYINHMSNIVLHIDYIVTSCLHRQQIMFFSKCDLGLKYMEKKIKLIAYKKIYIHIF